MTHNEVTTPAGTPGIYGVVHFKNTAVGVIPIDESGGTWVVAQTRYPFSAQTIEIPEGGCTLNELPFEAARRELAEEVGLRAECWRHLMCLQTSNSVTDEVADIFVAQNLTKVPQKLDDSEDIEAIYLPLKDVLDMVMTGKIVDAISVSGILRLAMEPDFQKWFK